MGKVAVLMGSRSDFSVVKSTVTTLKKFGIETCVRVISAHRTPDDAEEFCRKAKDDGIEIIICAAGKAAHLGGVIAARVALPVIALPIKTDMMGGLDSLLSMVQMPSGIPVACVGVNAAENAAILAAQILGVKYPGIYDRVCAYKAEMSDRIHEDDRAISEEIKSL